MITEDWIVGFVNGEGTFTFGGGNKISPYFQITLHIQDLEILQLIKDFLKDGTITIHKQHNSVTYYIQGIERCLRICYLFENKLIGIKKDDFERWKVGLKFLKENYFREWGKKPKQNILNFITNLLPEKNRKRKWD